MMDKFELALGELSDEYSKISLVASTEAGTAYWRGLRDGVEKSRNLYTNFIKEPCDETTNEQI